MESPTATRKIFGIPTPMAPIRPSNRRSKRSCSYDSVASYNEDDIDEATSPRLFRRRLDFAAMEDNEQSSPSLLGNFNGDYYLTEIAKFSRLNLLNAGGSDRKTPRKSGQDN
jgi:hypothetical protein